jgi:uncharacterized protein YqcC (DUF446 family)
MSFELRTERRQALRAALEELEQAMRRLDLWETTAPPPESLASPQPFSFDTLACHQWLQWQLIPRLRAALTASGPLPESSAILPYAEHCLTDPERDFTEVLTLIRRIDALITDEPGERLH